MTGIICKCHLTSLVEKCRLISLEESNDDSLDEISNEEISNEEIFLDETIEIMDDDHEEMEIIR